MNTITASRSQKVAEPIAPFFTPALYNNPSGKPWPVQARYIAGLNGLLFARFLKILPKCRFFRGCGHRFLWNRKRDRRIANPGTNRAYLGYGISEGQILIFPITRRKVPSNPGPVRPRIIPLDTYFPELCAKTGVLLHTFPGIA